MPPKKTILITLLLALALTRLSLAAADLKPRIFVLTDIAPITVEPDDMESMIRLMAHADLFQIEGLVSTTGWSDGGGREHPELITAVIDAYEKDLPNLMKRSNQTTFLPDESHQSIGYWPSPAYLRSKLAVGSAKRGLQFIGADNTSAGSDLLIKAADAPDDRPIYVGVWGGANTMAQSIWQIQHSRTPEQLKTFLHKLRIYTITDQDRAQGRGQYELSSHYWMRKDFADDLTFIWDESAWNFQNNTGKANWAQYTDQIQNHGALGTMYPKYKYGVEGDTPSYLYVMPNGLNDPEHPDFGGWGGIFQRGLSLDKTTTAWVNQSGTDTYAIARKYEQHFYPAIFNNFAARMQWAQSGKGNRNPIAIINGDDSLKILTFSPNAGATFSPDASQSKDPDGDTLTFNWWLLSEAGTYQNPITIQNESTPHPTIQIPADSAGKSFHIICEVTDNGTPPLTSYRRLIITPK